MPQVRGLSMKVLIFLLIFSLSSVIAETTMEDESLGTPSNPVSQGADTKSGISDGPVGPTEEQEEAHEERPESMGGAPNVGAGMGTGTGAGSTVGPAIKDDE